MKLCVLVPNDEYKSYAGTRIRYGRISPALNERGIDLSINSIGSFAAADADCDVLLISKCHDVRAIIMAASLRDRGVLVGVDLFDDYFSDPADSRLLRFRDWLGQLMTVCDFAVCSTEELADVAHRFSTTLPTHVMNDPAPVLEADRLKTLLVRKLNNAIEDREIQVVWYGVGDNPYFSVGLEDLASYGSVLDELTRAKMRVSLTILTNKRALSARGLSLIEQLPVQTEVFEWSEAAEQDLLRRRLLAFLPVNSQPFSRAKSLNRAVTALSAGCQVLSAGFPLYSALGRFIYRDTAQFIEDINRQSLRLSAQALPHYQKAIDQVASPSREAEGLASFLSELKAREPRPAQLIRLIHGQSTREEAHRLVKSLGGLSIASPYTRAKLDFDVVVRGSPYGLEMFVSRQTLSRLRSAAMRRYGRGVHHNGTIYLPLRRSHLRLAGGSTQHLDWQDRSEAFQLATYPDTMKQIAHHLNEAFGPSHTFYSEHSSLPFSSAIA